MKKLFDKVGKKKEKDGSLVGKVVLVGQFSVRVEAIVGEGGFATIYRVSDMKSGHPFALKHMRLGADSDSIKEVQREAKTMARLKGHPNILKLHAVAFAGPQGAETDGFMLLDYCPVTLLETMQRSNFVLDDFLVYEVFQDVVWAVAHMHKCSPPLAHRDLKAENVLKNSEGRWVICDFGSATARAQVYDTPAEIAAEEESIRRTTTPAYRAPEMWDLYSRQRIDTAVDVWALGVLLYVLAFGKLPFQGDSKLSILYGKYDMPPGRPPAMRSLIQDMLQVNPADRPDIFQVISKLDVLRNVLSSEPGVSGGGAGEPPGPMDRAPATAMAVAPGTMTPPPQHQQHQHQQHQQVQPHPQPHPQAYPNVHLPPHALQPVPGQAGPVAGQAAALGTAPITPAGPGGVEAGHPVLPAGPGGVEAGHPVLPASSAQRPVGAPPQGPPGAPAPVSYPAHGQPHVHLQPPQAHQPRPYPYPYPSQPPQQPSQAHHPEAPQQPARPGGPPAHPHPYPAHPQQHPHPQQGPWPGQPHTPGGQPAPGGPQQPPGLQRLPSRGQAGFTPTWPAPAQSAPPGPGSHPGASPAAHPVYQVPNLMDESYYQQQQHQQPAAAAAAAAAQSGAASSAVGAGTVADRVASAVSSAAAGAAATAAVPVAAAAVVMHGREAQHRVSEGPATVAAVALRPSAPPGSAGHGHRRTGSFSDSAAVRGHPGTNPNPATAAAVAAGDPVGFGDDDVDWGEHAAFGAAAPVPASAVPAQAPAALPPAPLPIAAPASDGLLLEQQPSRLPYPAQRSQDATPAELELVDSLPAVLSAAPTSNPAASSSSVSRTALPSPGAQRIQDGDVARSPWLSAGVAGPAALAAAPSAGGGLSGAGSGAAQFLPGPSGSEALAVGAAGSGAGVMPASAGVGVGVGGQAGASSDAAAGGREVELLRAQLQRMVAHSAQLEGRVRQLEGTVASQGALLTRVISELRALQHQHQHQEPADHQNQHHSSFQLGRHQHQQQLLPPTSVSAVPPGSQPASQAVPEQGPVRPEASGFSSGNVRAVGSPHAASQQQQQQQQQQQGSSAGAVSPLGGGAQAGISAGGSDGLGSGSWVHTTGQEAGGPRFEDSDTWGPKLADQLPSPGAVYPPLRYEDLA